MLQLLDGNFGIDALYARRRSKHRFVAVREVVDKSLREVAAVAAARGVDLGSDAIEKTWQRYDTLAPESTASLQRDVMEGKKSELEAQLGAVVRLGREAGVPVPVTEVLYACLLPQYHHAQ